MNANLALMLVAVHVALCLYAVNGFNAQKDFKFFVLVLTCDRANPDAKCLSCGGSLVADKTVVTSRYCIKLGYDPYDPNGFWDPYLKVVAGDFTDRFSQKEEIEVPQDKTVYILDVALVYLARKPTNRSPIPLCTSKYAQYNINVIGMGDHHPLTRRGVLHQVRLRERNATTCPEKNPDKFDEEVDICLSGDGKDRCHRYNGGPAFPEISNTCLYGVVSYDGEQCDSFGVYPRISEYVYWIEIYADNWGYKPDWLRQIS